jgi:paraquat-inducible protein A
LPTGAPDNPALIACPDCDLLLADQPAGHHQTTHCPRCGRVLYKKVTNSIRKTLTLSTTGLLLYLPAMLLPLMTFRAFGFRDSTNILETIAGLYSNGYYLVACMVAVSAVLFPLVLLTSIFVVSFNLYRGHSARYLSKLLRLYHSP